MNEQKTKCMIAAGNNRTIRDVGQSVAIGDKHFEVVKEFLYLGFLMTPTNNVSLELQRRIQTGNRCFFGLSKHLHSSHLWRQTKFTINKTLIRPVLLYGSETWVLTKKKDNQLFVFERKILRTICSPNIKNGVYSRRYNHSIKSLTARMPWMSRRQADCATLVTWSENPNTYHKKLYSEPSPLEGEI
jgi:hypothetical protein